MYVVKTGKFWQKTELEANNQHLHKIVNSWLHERIWSTTKNIALKLCFATSLKISIQSNVWNCEDPATLDFARENLADNDLVVRPCEEVIIL